MATSGSILGNPVRRREDPGILTGATEYFDDLQIAGMLHVAFVRSTIAHAVIEAIDTSDAVSMPGVVAVYTADDLDLPDHHGFMMLPPTMNRPPLARDRVRFVGDIVAVVVAETKAQAVDAAEAVIVDYDPLPAVVDPEAAIEADAPVVFEAQGSNIANGMGTGPVEGMLDDADVVDLGAHRQPARRAGADGAGRDRRRFPANPTAGSRSGRRRRARTVFATSSRRSSGSSRQSYAAPTTAVGGGFGAKCGHDRRVPDRRPRRRCCSAGP